MKAPRGVNVPLGPFSSTFQKLPFLSKRQVNFQNGGHHEHKVCCFDNRLSRLPYSSCCKRTAAREGPHSWYLATGLFANGSIKRRANEKTHEERIRRDT